MASSKSHGDTVEHRYVIEDSIDPKQHGGATMDTAILREDHPVLHLEEARNFYLGKKPPFAMSAEIRLLTRTAVIKSALGEQPLNPIRVEMVAR